MICSCLMCIQVFAFDYSNENSSFNNNYVKAWGRLKLVGNQLCSESGEPVQLRGWSTHGISWQGECFNGKDDFEGMKKKGANIARIAMYLIEGGREDLDWVKNCIQWTNELGMYCLVDWHMLKPGDPNDGAYGNPSNFFSQLSSWVSQNGFKNVLYEICNEPNENSVGDIYRPNVWSQIKTYSEKVLPAIAKGDPGAVVLVGTPQWDKALVFPMEDPINTHGLDVMYTFHHYTCDQQQFLGLLSSAAAFIPVFVSEWGLSADNGGEDGQVCEAGGDNLMKVCNGENLGNQKISWCNWSWSADYRSSSALRGCGNYSEGNLTQSGSYITRQLRKGDVFTSSQSTPLDQAQPIKASEDSYIALEKYDKGGQNKAFFEFDDSWIFDINGSCNAGGEARKDECVDLGKTGDDEPFYYNLGYVVAGEWVKYSVNVEKAGVYEFETYTNNHIDNNVIAICVDGENAIVDETGSDFYKAVRLKTSGSGDKDGGYGDWAWTTPYSEYAGQNKKFFIRFKKSGVQTLGISFMSSCAGLGSLKFKAIEQLKPPYEEPEDPNGTSAISVFSEAGEFIIWPNPSKGGEFNINLSESANVAIYGTIGNCIYNETLPEGESKINVSAPAGNYILMVKSQNKSSVQKLIIQ